MKLIAKMVNFNLKVMSINVRGLNDREKRRGVFRWIKRGNSAVCFIQESYSIQDCEQIWRSEWGGNIFLHMVETMPELY